jgi:glucose-6-phosphate isomerase
MSMAKSLAPLTKLAAWQALEAHYPKVQELHLRKLFANDPKRGERMALEAVGIYYDYSKHRITEETLRLLLQLAEESGLRARIDAMFRGEKINVTEKRAVLHVALRAPKGQSLVVDGEDGRFLHPGAQRGVEGPHRQADPQHHQYRHRRI